MKSERKIFIAFVLNFAFSIFEFVGGIVSGSVAILSDAVHDIGDALSIGASYFLEKKSKKAPDENYTYGYARYSVMGGVITTLILLFGSAAVIYNAVLRLLNPTEINYDAMIIFAVVGAAVNFLAAYFTSGGEGINQRAVNLHMLEDVLGWLVVLVGAVVMRFTDFAIIDPLMSIGVAVFILVNALKNLKEIFDLLVVKTPKNLSVKEVELKVCEVKGVLGVHHVHLWSLDGEGIYATMHIVADSEGAKVKAAVKAELKNLGIEHATLELEREDEDCAETTCRAPEHPHTCGHHHHHHGHAHSHDRHGHQHSHHHQHTHNCHH